MNAVRRSAAVAASVLLIVAGLIGPSRPAAGAAPAEAEPVWRIIEVATPVIAAPGIVAEATAQCPAGHAVIGGDIRDMSNFRHILPKAAYPDWGSQSFLGAAAIDANEEQSFTVVAYCLPSALVSGVTVKEVSINPPGGAFGSGPAGGSATCNAGQRVIGGGARLWDYTTSGTGYLFANSPLQTGNGWYGTGNLYQSAILVVALCLPEASAPALTLATRTFDNTIGTYAYFISSASANCPETTRVLTGGAYTAVDGQFPNSADPNQGRVAESNSRTGYWSGTVGMNHGYESTTVVWCIPDKDPPKVTMTSPAATPLAARTTLTSAVQVGWTGSDAADDVVRYQTRRRSAPYNGVFGAWEYPPSWQDLATNSVTQGSLLLGRTYCYSTRGQDPAGNWSTWAGQRCAVRPLDDRSLAVSSGWVRRSAGTHWNGTYTSTTQQNATMTRTGARYNQLALVATKCPTCGRVAVKHNGTLLGTVNLANATTAHRQVIALPRTPGRVGTVTITVLTSGKDIQIDGLVISSN